MAFQPSTCSRTIASRRWIGSAIGVVGREAPVGAGRRRVLGEDALDGVGTGAVAEARPADRRQLVDVERRVLALGVEDRLADLGRQGAVLLDLRGRHEAGHARAGRSGRPGGRAVRSAAPVSAARSAGRLAEEDDRADQLVGPLPRRPRQQRDLVPVVGRLDPRPWRHPPAPLPVSSSKGAHYRGEQNAPRRHDGTALREGSMPVTYTNRKGVTYTLYRGRRRPARPATSSAARPTGDPVAALPPGFAIRESPNGVVSLVKERPALIRPEEIAAVEAAVRLHPQARGLPGRRQARPDRGLRPGSARFRRVGTAAARGRHGANRAGRRAAGGGGAAGALRAGAAVPPPRSGAADVLGAATDAFYDLR